MTEYMILHEPRGACPYVLYKHTTDGPRGKRIDRMEKVGAYFTKKEAYKQRAKLQSQLPASQIWDDRLLGWDSYYTKEKEKKNGKGNTQPAGLGRKTGADKRH
ncbi:hypothetical protein [Faecalibaculum rodentium]|uniref:hypothetical protein n=1 Tax=Faecalibaculum rodentium TaxID=1702221 RepID=UPI0023F2612D|nr:hypothetical protein [Faecalibaculum rodentium]